MQRLSPTPYTFETLSPGSHSFAVKQVLHCGANKWSQVCAGSLRSPEGKEQENLVLKVFVPALFPIPRKDPAIPDENIFAPLFRKLDMPDTISKGSFRYTDELMAWSEVHAYSKLSSLQGTVIPRLIGAFMIMSPDSDTDLEHLAIATERIRGQSIVGRCRELGSMVNGDTRWYPIAFELFRKVYEIHQLGLVDLDIHDANVLIVDNHTSAPASPCVKFFDFAFSRPNHFHKPKDMKRHDVKLVTEHDLFRLGRLLKRICGDGDEDPECSHSFGVRMRNFMTWAGREHPDEPWLDAWGGKYAYLERFT